MSHIYRYTIKSTLTKIQTLLCFLCITIRNFMWYKILDGIRERKAPSDKLKQRFLFYSKSSLYGQ